MNEATGSPQPFEESLAELERIVEALEDGQLGLDEALTRYEEGVALVKLCHARLQQAEQRILLVTRIDPRGQPVLQPFKHEATG